ncbi:MAG: phenylalanine--tRNA ligase subunit beta [Actinobacteria bacterium]|nr:MAG: phenylalanine--tRNA ligase subunit beta [Actinomycetota bacterium]
MKILHSWLNEFADFGTDVDAIAESITKLGLAVEGIEIVGLPVAGVVVAKVLRTERHPDAAKVHRVYVDAGDGVEKHVWCGAFNMQPGDLIPLATLGTQMPDGRVIGQRGILGIDSEGMLCSGTELGLSADATGIMILPSHLELGTDVFSALGITKDVVFDLDVTRNRPDCTGYLGVARDLAAHLGLSLLPHKDAAIASGKKHSIPVDIRATDRCGRFSVTVMSGVVVTDSPAWIAQRLSRAGMRSINNVVDVSNLVNLELNQPNHAYDLNTVADGFIVRCANDTEAITTLDDASRTLGPQDLLICDAKDRPVGIAGIMGGAGSQISSSTTAIALEIAWFEPLGIAASVSRLSLRTEASLRFERGVDPYGSDLAVARFAQLLSLTCPDLVVHAQGTDARTDALPAQDRSTSLRLDQIKRVLGIDIDVDRVRSLIEPIGFGVLQPDTSNAVTIIVPSWRPDCSQEIDVIEEIARHYGYDEIGKVVPKSPVHGRLSAVQQRRRGVRDFVLSLGASEAMPNPFLAPGDLLRCGLSEDNALRLANPLVAEESVLRTSLRPGLLRAIAYNQSHRINDVSLFEVGHVYPQGVEQLPDEHEVLCVVFAEADATKAMDCWSQISQYLGIGAQLFQDVAPGGFHGTRSAQLRRGKIVLGAVGEIDPTVLANYGVFGRVACVEINLSIVLGETPKVALAQVVSKYPSSDFDLAFTVPQTVAAGLLLKSLRQAAGNLLAELALFDIYRGKGVVEGSRSLAYRLRFQAPDRTLADTEIADARARCIAAAQKLGAELR